VTREESREAKKYKKQRKGGVSRKGRFFEAQKEKRGKPAGRGGGEPSGNWYDLLGQVPYNRGELHEGGHRKGEVEGEG